MSRWGLIPLLVFICLGAIALGGVEILYRWKVQPGLEANLKTEERHLRLYLEDLEFFSRIKDLYPNPKGQADAGALLNTRLKWVPEPDAGTADDTSGEMKAASARPHIVSLDLREQLLRFGNDWIRQQHKSVHWKVDLSLFGELPKFDHWDIESNSPIAKLIANDAFVPPPKMPLPDLQDLLAATKVRLMIGATDGDPVKALSEVRQLARLLLTTENQQLVIAGLAALDNERRAYRYFVDEKGLNEAAWTPIDRNVTRRARRAIYATRGYLRLWTPEKILEQIYLGEQDPIGLCSAANEAFPLEYSLRPMLEPYWPFERDYSAAFRRLDRILKRSQSRCRLRYLTHLMKTGGFRARVPGPWLLKRVPYSRKVFGMRASVMNFSGFELYNALLVPGASGGASGI